MRFTVKTTARLVALCLGLALLFSACAKESAALQSTAGSGSQTANVAYVPPPILNVWVLSGNDKAYFGSAIEDMRNVGLVASDFLVNTEYGVEMLPNWTLDKTVTEEEAIDRLITEMLAGTGPDIIVMDGLNAQDFAAQGLLMDLSDLAAEAGVYDNLVESLKINGELPYIPYDFWAPLLVGDPTAVNDMQSFTQLAGEVASDPVLRWPPPGMVLDPNDRIIYWGNGDTDMVSEHSGGLAVPPADMPYFVQTSENDPVMMADAVSLSPEERQRVSLMLGPKWQDTHKGVYPLYAPFLIEENAINTPQLTEYFTVIKQIEDARPPIPTDRFYYYDLYMMFPGMMMHNATAGSMPVNPPLANWYLGYSSMAYVSRVEFTIPSILASARGLPLAVRPVPAVGTVWRPKMLMAVSKNAKNPELALRFIRGMLQDDMQKINETRAGLTQSFKTMPVTESAAKQATETQLPLRLRQYYLLNSAIFDKVCLEQSYDIAWLNAHEFAYDLDGLIRSFDTAYLPDAVVEAAVEENLSAVLSGARTPAEAARQCEEDLQVYLAERQR